MNRGEAINILKNTETEWLGTNKDREETQQAIDMAIEALSSDAIAKAYNQGFVEGAVNATVDLQSRVYKSVKVAPVEYEPFNKGGDPE